MGVPSIDGSCRDEILDWASMLPGKSYREEYNKGESKILHETQHGAVN
jgi:hypothetical protein